MGDEVEDEKAEEGEQRDEVDGSIRSRAPSNPLLQLDPIASAFAAGELGFGDRRSEGVAMHRPASLCRRSGRVSRKREECLLKEDLPRLINELIHV